MSDSLPHGLVFFARGKTQRQRRARVVFALLLLLTAAALIWPGFPLAAGILPATILGLPFALAWVVLWLFIVLGAQIWLYRLDLREETP